MAGERKGKTYEAIIKVALDQLVADGDLKGNIFWNEKAAGMSVIPDFTVGTDKDHPDNIFLVTHSGSAKESEKKNWRNLGELAECKLRLKTIPKVNSIAFDSLIKKNLKSAGASTFDAQLFIEDRPYGKNLMSWVDDNNDKLPKDGEEKAAEISGILRRNDKRFSPIYSGILSDVRTMIGLSNPALNHLWVQERKRPIVQAPKARETFVRRGFTKLSVFPSLADKPLSPKVTLNRDDNELAVALGFAKKTLGGLQITDKEMLWVMANFAPPERRTVLAEQPLDRMTVWIEPLRELPRLSFQLTWITEHWSELQSAETLFGHLRKCSANPTSLGPPVPQCSRRVWLFHLLLDVLKVLSATQQGYGLAVLLADLRKLKPKPQHKHEVFKLARAANVLDVQWRDERGISLGLGDWANGPSAQGFSLYPDDLARVADALSMRLAQHSANALKQVLPKIKASVIATNLEARLMTYRLFDPVGTMIRRMLTAKGLTHRISPTEASCFSQYATLAFNAQLDPRAGGTSVIQSKKTLINWQSSHDSHTKDKTKELCGRAVALRYTWDSNTKQFTPRPGVVKLCLVVDGTWTQEDLDTLARAGWDEILYPDELDKLTKAIA